MLYGCNRWADARFIRYICYIIVPHPMPIKREIPNECLIHTKTLLIDHRAAMRGIGEHRVGCAKHYQRALTAEMVKDSLVVLKNITLI